MDHKTKMVLTYLEHEVKKSIDKYYTLDCCIAATRIALDVLGHFEIPAMQLTTRVMICNGVYADWIMTHDKLPQGEEERNEAFANGGWGVGLGFPNPTVKPSKGKGFGGHLIAYLEEGYIVDLSLPQGTRPRHNIRLKPLVAKTQPNFLEERMMCIRYPQREGGDLLLHYTLIENEAYTKSIDWATDRRKVVSYPAISTIDAMLRRGDGSQPGGGQQEETPEAPA